MVQLQVALSDQSWGLLPSLTTDPGPHVSSGLRMGSVGDHVNWRSA
jgi:hypothetical protein